MNLFSDRTIIRNTNPKKPKKMNYPRTTKRLMLISVWSLASALAQAQLAESNSSNSDERVVKLSPFTVSSETGSGYGVSSSSTATRTNEKLIDIPQSVTVVTSELWEDTGATSYDAALNYAGNVFVRNRSGGDIQFMSRGFTIASGDGFAADGVRLYGYRRDLAAYDRVEVVKGPPSAVQGRGSNAGLVNFTYKKPVYGKVFSNGKVTVGGYDFERPFYRGEIDLNRSLNDSGTMAGRLIGVIQTSDGFLDYQSGINKVYGAFPSLRWQLSDRTEITVNTELLQTNSPFREPGQGFTFHPGGLRRMVPGLNTNSDPLTALNLPRDFNAGGKVSGLEENTGAIFVSLVNEYSDYLSLRQVFNYFTYESDGEWWDAAGNLPVQGADGSLTNPYSWGRNKSDRNGFTLQGDAILSYGPETFPLTTMVGYAYADDSTDTDNYQGTRVPARFDFRRPTLDRQITNVQLAGNSSRSESTTWGIYLQQDLKLFDERLAFIGGVRRDFGDNSNRNPVTGAISNNESTVNSYRYGTTFKITPNVALYGVYSEQNDPTFTTPRFTLAPAGDPRLNETITATPSTELMEVGVKGEFLSGRITATLAYYEITRSGSVNTFSFTEEIPPGSGNTAVFTELVLTDGDSSKGWEVQAFGSITDQLSVIGSFALNDSSQPAGGGGTQKLRFVPEWTGNIFLKQSFLDTEGGGFEIRGGARWMGPFVAGATGANPTGRVDIANQYSIDLGASYRWNDRQQIDLQVNNVTNQWYMLVRADPPRSWRLSYKFSF